MPLEACISALHKFTTRVRLHLQGGKAIVSSDSAISPQAASPSLQLAAFQRGLTSLPITRRDFWGPALRGLQRRLPQLCSTGSSQPVCRHGGVEVRETTTTARTASAGNSWKSYSSLHKPWQLFAHSTATGSVCSQDAGKEPSHPPRDGIPTARQPMKIRGESGADPHLARSRAGTTSESIFPSGPRPLACKPQGQTRPPVPRPGAGSTAPFGEGSGSEPVRNDAPGKASACNLASKTPPRTARRMLRCYFHTLNRRGLHQNTQGQETSMVQGNLHLLKH